MRALQMLKLSAYNHLTNRTSFRGDVLSLKAFLSTLTLTELSLLGFPPDILLHAIQSSGLSLYHLGFHIREDPMELGIRCGPSLSPLLLSTAQLKTIKSTCPALQSLTFDVTKSSLLIPENPSRNSPPLLLPPTAIASSLKPLSETDHSLLLTLATTPALQHIRLFLHIDPTGRTHHNDPLLTTADVLAIYAYLRSFKRGSPLKNLLICAQERFEMWESGPERVVTVERCNGMNRRTREAWDINDNVMRGREERREDQWYTSRPVWGATEVWG